MFGAVPVGRDKPDGPWKSDRVLRASRGSPQTLIPPELRKPIRRKRSVSGCRLQIAMAEIVRQRPSILALIGELIARRMPQHVRMNWKWKPRSLASTLDQEPRRCNRSASFGDEHIRTVALQWPQCSQFRSMQRVNALDPAFSSIHMKATIPQINLSPSQGAEFSGSKSMPICQEDRRCIPSAIPSTVACCLDQPINLFLGQILPYSIGCVGQAA